MMASVPASYERRPGPSIAGLSRVARNLVERPPPARWEECRLAADPRWQAPLLAAMMYQLPAAKVPDSPLMEKAREAVARVMG